MATIKISLDKRKIKKDESYTICFRIYYQNKSTTRSSKIDVTENHWDNKKKVIKKSHPNSVALNKILQKKLADLQSELLLADDIKIQQFLNPPIQILEEIKQKQTVYHFVNDLINELKKDNKIGNAWVYESSLNALKRFHPSEDLYFEQIDFKFLDDYNKSLIRRKIKHNTAFLYLRTLRAFYNKAIKLRIVDRNAYPFHDISLKGEKTKKRAIQKELITEIIKLDLIKGSTIWHVRNWFMLSFYLVGISFVDLALLTPDNIKENRITYKRQKTGKMYNINILPQASAILNTYKGTHYGFLLPIINRETRSFTERLRLIKDRTRLANKYLSKVAELIETTETITTYTTRHSWATICKKLGFSIEIIAESLGHEYGNKTTAVYLDIFDQEVLDEANKLVARSLKYKVSLRRA